MQRAPYGELGDVSPSPPRRAVAVMAKQPAHGWTKTRLVPRLTPEAAADLYECFLLDALDLARSIAGVTPIVAIAPPEATDYFRGIAPDLEQVPQIGASLGERLDHVLTHSLEAGFDHVVAINSDSPTLPASYVAEAFSRLAEEAVDVVLGPADDGGYYLIGWKRAHSRLVRDVAMSTPHVLRDTLDLAAASGIRVSLLAQWYDVDEPADLDRVEADLHVSLERGQHTRRLLAQLHGAAG